MHDGNNQYFALESKININYVRTPLTLPDLRICVGRSLIKVPSTTGTKTNVPKNPLRLILVFAA